MSRLDSNDGSGDLVREAKRAAYREVILDVAEQVFARDGFQGAQVKAVAKGARVSLSTVYNCFPNKMDLYRAVHARRLEQLMARLAEVGPARAPLDQMLEGIRIYVTFHMEHTTYLRMHLREGIAWSGAAGLRSPEQLETWTRGLQRMARTLQAGVDEGSLEVDDPMWAARTINAMHQVALSQWVDDGMDESPSSLTRRLHRQFVRTFCAPRQVVDLLAGLD